MTNKTDMGYHPMDLFQRGGIMSNISIREISIVDLNTDAIFKAAYDSVQIAC